MSLSVTPYAGDNLPGAAGIAAHRTLVATIDSMDDAIDQLTEELAAFCFDHLENGAMSNNNADPDLSIDADAFEKVRDYI